MGAYHDGCATYYYNFTLVKLVIKQLNILEVKKWEVQDGLDEEQEGGQQDERHIVQCAGHADGEGEG